ncbi:hypothetical protein BGZ80_008142, partial [Entomortierella chlamydospora]
MKDASIHSRTSNSSTNRPEADLRASPSLSRQGTITTDAQQPSKDPLNSSDTITVVSGKDMFASDNLESGSSLTVNKDEIDIESGVPKNEEKTSDQILSQEVKTLPMRELLPAFLGVALTLFMAALDNTIVSTALPRIGTDFQASNKVELVLTCYVVASNAFQ